MSGAVAIDLSSVGPELLPALAYIRAELTLRARGRAGDEPRVVPFWIEDRGWLYVPRGWLLTPIGQWFAQAADFLERRSDGAALPPGTRVGGITWGAPPFPRGQGKFIEDGARGAAANGHGGLLKAPTRSGKTFCSLEVACRLGRSTLVLVDTTIIMDQWRRAIEGDPLDPRSPRIVDGRGVPLRCGIIREGSFEAGAPFAVGMVQTLSRRELPEWARRAFGTIVVDECQGAAADSIFGALMRFEPRYVLGLSATPDRPDGLGASIPWLIGPEVARLERRLEADVVYIPLPLRKSVVVEKERDATDDQGNVVGREKYMGRLAFTRYGQFNAVNAEKMLAADPERIAAIGAAAIRSRNEGRRTLVAVGLREHAAKFYDFFMQNGLRAGMLLGGAEDPRREMQNEILVATARYIGKGADIQPCATTLLVAAPFGDMRQLGGRVLNPQAPHRSVIAECVDLERNCVKQAFKRRNYYTSHEHDFTCGHCRRLMRDGCGCAAGIFDGPHMRGKG
jgi:superfamily II DNA or RNA helicase